MLSAADYEDQPIDEAVDSESVVLATLMCRPDAVAKVIGQVTEKEFYRPAHKYLFRAITSLVSENSAVDLTTVTSWLGAHKSLTKAGGKQYLGELALGATTVVEGLQHHLQRIKESADRRLLKSTSNEVGACISDTTRSPAELAELAASKFQALKESGSSFRPSTVRDLMTQNFEPLRWTINDLLPEGLTILAGAPKLGKSWLALDIAIAVSKGEKVLGDYDTDRGEVLYLALEDSDRRLQRRINALCEDDAQEMSKLFYETDIAPMENGGIRALEDWLEAHPQCRLVIIDTLAKFAPKQERGANAYQHDYATGSRLQKLALKFKLALLIVTHVRKLKSGDVFDEISGSNGVTGSADASWVLKRARTETTGTLTVTGRDIEEMQLTAVFNKETCRWSIEGDVRQVARRETLVKLTAQFGSNPFTCPMAKDALSISKAHSKRVVNDLASAGYLVRLPEKVGKAFQFKLTDRFIDNTFAFGSEAS